MKTVVSIRSLAFAAAIALAAAPAGASRTPKGGPRAPASSLPSRAAELSPVALHAMPRVAQASAVLGFEVGEEHRYVLGPARSLGRGETGMWSIRLEEIHARADGSPEGLFALRHEWQAPQPVADPPLRAITRVKSEGRLRVNAHGFPLFIHYETIRHLAGLGDEAYTVDYELDEQRRRFDKSTTMEGVRWYQNVEIRDHDTINRRAAEGLFVFLPAVPGCLDRFVATYDVRGTNPQPRSATAPTNSAAQATQPVKVADNADCEESLFANPGLLNLVMPALWEAGGEREYVFFTPIGAVGKPETGVAVGVPAGGPPIVPGSIGRSPGLGSMGGFPDRRGESVSTTAATYHEVETLEFVDRVSVRVGQRSTEAWRIELSDDLGPVYVNDDGVVLRIDLPGIGTGAPRFLRRLWPSEF